MKLLLPLLGLALPASCHVFGHGHGNSHGHGMGHGRGHGHGGHHMPHGWTFPDLGDVDEWRRRGGNVWEDLKGAIGAEKIKVAALEKAKEGLELAMETLRREKEALERKWKGHKDECKKQEEKAKKQGKKELEGALKAAKDKSARKQTELEAERKKRRGVEGERRELRAKLEAERARAAMLSQELERVGARSRELEAQMEDAALESEDARQAEVLRATMQAAAYDDLDDSNASCAGVWPPCGRSPAEARANIMVFWTVTAALVSIGIIVGLSGEAPAEKVAREAAQRAREEEVELAEKLALCLQQAVTAKAELDGQAELAAGSAEAQAAQEAERRIEAAVFSMGFYSMRVKDQPESFPVLAWLLERVERLAEDGLRGAIEKVPAGCLDGDFTWRVWDEAADEEPARKVKIQCPGARREDVSVDVIFNGCIVRIARPASAGAEEREFAQRFQFRPSDGLFEFCDEKAVLDQGHLQLEFRPGDRSAAVDGDPGQPVREFRRRIFRLPPHGSSDKDGSWELPSIATEPSISVPGSQVGTDDDEASAPATATELQRSPSCTSEEFEFELVQSSDAQPGTEAQPLA